VANELEAIVTVGNTDVRYPHLVEYGTSDTPAQPFFWPGFRLTRKRAANRIKRAISTAVKKNWGSGK
jgi:HK97 gp10 family phage protein